METSQNNTMVDFLSVKPMFGCRQCGYNTKCPLKIIQHQAGKDCHRPDYLNNRIDVQERWIDCLVADFVKHTAL